MSSSKLPKQNTSISLPFSDQTQDPPKLSKTDFCQTRAFLKNWNRDEDPAMEPAQQLPHGNIKESRLHVTSQADAARNNPWFFA
jgi:hypothetical protein